ncbi:hypothetical protein LZ32DRAFT_602315 [Colletotrichum eremochloae]|nr:hypothetical protein LZ32DRAFT_602315 [Colletotrichum eremochloae]
MGARDSRPTRRLTPSRGGLICVAWSSVAKSGTCWCWISKGRASKGEQCVVSAQGVLYLDEVVGDAGLRWFGECRKQRLGTKGGVWAQDYYYYYYYLPAETDLKGSLTGVYLHK